MQTPHCRRQTFLPLRSLYGLACCLLPLMAGCTSSTDGNNPRISARPPKEISPEVRQKIQQEIQAANQAHGVVGPPPQFKAATGTK